MSKRFVCCVIDMILVAILAELVFMGLFKITQNTALYNGAMETIDEEIAYYEDLTKDTHIVEYVDGSRVSTDVIVLKNLYRAIYLSYEIFGNNQQPNFYFEDGHDVTINGVHSTENDNVAYFYTKYLKENPSVDINADDDLFEIYKKAFGDDASFIFSFNKDISDMPVLNTQVAYYLFHYLFINDSDTIGQTGATYYEAYRVAYTAMLEEAENLILNSEPYYSTHYLDYREAYSAQAKYTNVTLILSIFISCFIVLLIPKYLFKDEKTIGYKLFGLGVIRVDGSANRWYVSVIKTLIDCIGFIPIAFILYLFPPFKGGYEAMFVPINVGSSISFALIILLIMLVGAVINAVGLFTSKKQNLINLIFNDVVVDVHRLEEEGDGSTNQGREY